MQELKVLSYNIHVAMDTKNTPHYLMHSWHHLMPHPRRLKNLALISEIIRPFDIVGLQEVDAGSFRSANIDQIAFLAAEADFPYSQLQTTRNFGRLAKHSKGLLSRYTIHNVHHYTLPSRLPGRGLTTFCLGEEKAPILVVNAHLSLGTKANTLQLDFIQTLIAGYEHVIVMGDLNVDPQALSEHPLIKNQRLRIANHGATFPSWKPKRQLDYILVSSAIVIGKSGTLSCSFSDHLPVFATLQLPQGVTLR